MTVTYTHEVANARLGGFSRLLLRWRGSVYKLFYKEFLIYITFYTLVSFTYRFGLKEMQRIYFEKLCLQFEHYTDLIPISFVLGFYVTIVVGRWWSQFEYLPWPDRLMMIVASNVHGLDDRGRMLRRTLVRYLNLAQVLTYRRISTAVYKRFPTMEHVVSAGMMTKKEHQLYEQVSSKNVKYWVPILWFNNLVSKARQDGRVYDDIIYSLILKEANDFRGCCGFLLSYDWISIPLVYTQVVTVAVYMFFCSTLISRQYLDTSRNYDGHGVDLVVPIFTIAQFFFYVGWLKVAEQLINPFGEDDDDFELNSVIDRNLEVSFLAVDNLYRQHPKLEKDEFWNNSNPVLPYTAASLNHKIEPFLGSTFDMRLTKEGQNLKEEQFFPAEEVSAPLNGNLDQGLSKDDETHSTSSIQKTSQCLPMSRKTDRTLMKKFSCAKLQASKNSILQETSSSDSSDESHDDQVSEDEDHDRLTLELADSNPNLEVVEKNKNFLYDPNNNKFPSLDVGLANKTSSQTYIDSLSWGSLSRTGCGAKGGSILNNKSEADEIISRNQSLVLNQLEPHFPKQQGRPKNLNLNIQFSSDSTYPIPSSIRLQCDDDKSEDRKNAEKRVHLYERKRRNRLGYPSRKRSRRSTSGSSIWVERQQRLLSETMSESPGMSAWSESDVGSGPVEDSPMGSLISCSTSVPSPKLLRWAYKPTASNNYGDTTSIASTVTSPLGNEVAETEPTFTIGTPPTSTLAFEQEQTLPLNNSQHFFQRSDSSASSGKEDSITPYTDDLRRRLQVVSSSSPAPSSPVKHNHFFPSPQQMTGSMFNNATSKIYSKTSRPKADETKVKLTAHQDGISTPSATAIPNKLPRVFASSQQNKSHIKLQNEDSFSIFSPEPKSLRRNNSNGLWQAFKTWNTKRKEIKKEKENPPLPVYVTNSNVNKFERNSQIESKTSGKKSNPKYQEQPRAMQKHHPKLKLDIATATKASNTTITRRSLTESNTKTDSFQIESNLNTGVQIESNLNSTNSSSHSFIPVLHESVSKEDQDEFSPQLQLNHKTELKSNSPSNTKLTAIEKSLSTNLNKKDIPLLSLTNKSFPSNNESFKTSDVDPKFENYRNHPTGIVEQNVSNLCEPNISDADQLVSILNHEQTKSTCENVSKNHTSNFDCMNPLSSTDSDKTPSISNVDHPQFSLDVILEIPSDDDGEFKPAPFDHNDTQIELNSRTTNMLQESKFFLADTPNHHTVTTTNVHIGS